ncbi:hypothetical protein TWF192_005440 [Orbilia oligospora]|nr:hypothetical protein TWF192_005440 [Orbilia oligospora]
MSEADAKSSDPGEGEETMLARIIKYELSGLLVLRDKLPQPHGACTICLEEKKGQCGYLPDSLAKADEFENLLWTCPSCADLFDNPYPTIIILPKNLDFFVLWEHRDYERRTEEANSGAVVSPRTVPEHDDYKGLYKFYVLTNDPTTIPERLRVRIENDERDLYTEASPTALILHAGRVLVKSTTKTPKSKRVKMKELTREDDRQRRRAEAQGKEYTSPASPEKWQYSFSTRSLPKLVLGERKNAARVDRPISAGPSEQKNSEVEENGSGDHDEEYEEEERDGENYKVGSLEYSDDDDEGWDYGPQMTSSAIIERASKRSTKR